MVTNNAVGQESRNKINLPRKIRGLAFFAAAMLAACVPVDNPSGGGDGDEKDKVIAVTGVSLDKPSVEMKVGETVTLTATVSPSNASDKSVKWSSSLARVASVEDGMVTAHAAGTADITVTTVSGGKKAVCNVTVKAAPSEPYVETSDPTNVTCVSARLPGKTNIDVTGKEYGVIISSERDKCNPTSGETFFTSTNYSKGVFYNIIGGMSPESVHYFRAFVRESGDYVLGEIKTIETKPLTSMIEIQDVTNMTPFWAITDVKVDLTDIPYENIPAGIRVRKSGLDTYGEYKVDKLEKDFSRIWISLLAETEYIYYAYATIGTRTYNTPEKTFTTPKLSTVLRTEEPSDVTRTTATLRGFLDLTGVTTNSKSIYFLFGAKGSSSQQKVTGKLSGTTVTASVSGLKASTEYDCTLCLVLDKNTHTGETVSFTTPAPETVPVSSVSLDKTSLNLKVGESSKLTATVLPANATDKTVTWSSSDASVASVYNDGTVAALSEGTAVIKAESGGKEATCTVTVAASVVPVSSVSLDKTSLNLKVGESSKLTATVLPANATDKTVTWSSSDTSVAIVDNDGTVVGIAPGTTAVLASAGGKIAACAVTVVSSSVPVSSITLDRSTLGMKIGETAKLTATVLPENATDKTVTWSSSDASVASVSSSGEVKALKTGATVILATAGGKIATCTVTVDSKPIEVTSVTLDKTEAELVEGESVLLRATVLPEDATNPEVTWTSSNTSVATVSSAGLVKAVIEGTATITAKAGSKSATCKITVRRKEIPVTSITLDRTSVTIEVDEQVDLNATVLPENATNPKVTWSTSNSSVAVVTGHGQVVGTGEGTATITARAGEKSATCKVTVIKKVVPVTYVSLNYTEIEVERAWTITLKATVHPDNATNKTVTWSSSDSKTVSVDNNGNITAKKAGTATITATAGGCSATCKVTVVVPVNLVTLDHTSIKIKQNEKFKLTATVSPADATNATLRWSSKYTAVAEVDGAGVVTGMGEGETVITVSAGGVSATCKVVVSNTATGGHEGTDTEIWD